MPKRSSTKKQKDLNQSAFDIVSAITESQPPTEKNAAAVALGKMGGLKGGKARALALSASQRKAIAEKAAAARWGTKKTKK